MPNTKTAEQLKAELKEQKERKEQSDAALAAQQVTAAKMMQDKPLETGQASSRQFIKKTKDKENNENQEDPMEVYRRWLAKYKKLHKCEEDDDSFKDKGDGSYELNFKDLDAEEDFLRELAKTGDGAVICCDVPIAYQKNGELIDPRTNQEFLKGEYAALVRQIKQELKDLKKERYDTAGQVQSGAFKPKLSQDVVRDIMSRPPKTASMTPGSDTCLVAPTPSNVLSELSDSKKETKGVTANTTQADQDDEHLGPST